MRRKIYRELMAWKKNNEKRSPLYIKGQYGTGKSYMVKQFAENQYKSYAIIDLANPHALIRDCFKNNFPDLNSFFLSVSTIYQIALYRHESLIVFDEYSNSIEARRFFKRLAEDGRYDYIVIDSFPSLMRLKDEYSFPEENVLTLQPMDFEEYLWARGDNYLADLIKTCYERRLPLAYTNHRKALNSFEHYVLIGGMPEAVKLFSETLDLFETDRLRKKLITQTRLLLTKRYSRYENRINVILDSTPSQLNKSDKQFRLNAADQALRFRNYSAAFEILENCGLLNISRKAFDFTTETGEESGEKKEVLIVGTKDHSIKCYWSDCGMLLSMLSDNESLDENNRSIIVGDFSASHSMVVENAVAQMLVSSNHKLLYYSNVDPYHRENHMAIDFLLRDGDDKIKPISLKPDNYKLSSSIEKFTSRYSRIISEKIILTANDVMMQSGITNLPFYMAWLL